MASAEVIVFCSDGDPDPLQGTLSWTETEPNHFSIDPDGPLVQKCIRHHLKSGGPQQHDHFLVFRNAINLPQSVILTPDDNARKKYPRSIGSFGIGRTTSASGTLWELP